MAKRNSLCVFAIYQQMSGRRHTWRGGGFGRSTALKTFNIRRVEINDRSAAVSRLDAVARRCRDEMLRYIAIDATDNDARPSRPRKVFWTPTELSPKKQDG
jgi:hypothetical protein